MNSFPFFNKATSLLIVDDEPSLLDILSKALQKKFPEFHILTAANGREGLVTLSKRPAISLLLLDLEMPVMGGLEMLKRVREKNSDIKVLIMTGKSCHDRAIQCANLNVQGYLVKPFQPGDLILRINKVLNIEFWGPLRTLWEDDFEKKLSSMSNAVKCAIQFIHQNYQKNINRKDIAKYLNITPEYLSDKFHKECGIQLRDYINIHRIEKSKEYLSGNDNLMIKEVAVSVGIPDNAHFSRLFKKYTGFMPGEFKKKFML